ncbi:rod shape-determining protein [Tepidimicrobium xylanilyticum]|uniref:Cell shape-determining protein MreB n=1 Tax=Tepidimicrobium xylanilyticum TaxID=1123352 RepID=A0A1H2QXJ7_9FIRM|nr:rod shape-determining protein MreB [Tepidimicrobium xylanilyticum]GMG95560.1 rod shape-determining protein [Tepidimicrobium xylanilyticum]SDW11893.1 rod shape-determining protein MreB [Tepidimicrobium xylanilyticum]
MAAFRTDLGIDLGTASILVYVKGKGVVLNEPSVVAIDQYTNKFLAVGEEAKKMLGRTPGNIIALRPMRDGVISNYQITERMLKYFFTKAIGKTIFKPRVIVCVPSGITEVEKRAVLEASNHAGARRTFLIEEPIAAAIGAGIDITEPNGNMIVDIGGGTTDVAVISLGGIVISRSVKIAGDECNEAIARYIRKKHNLMIGERSAEEIKIQVGSAYPREKDVSIEVRGRNLLTGLPKNIKIYSSEALEALAEPVSHIIETIHYVLERTPPELAADIADKGIIMTGGGALLYGLDKLITEKTGIKARLVDDPISSVAIGTGRALDWVKFLDSDKTGSDSIRINY